MRSALSLIRQASSCQSVRSIAFWSKVEKGPEDPILGLTVAFNKDTFEKKVNLGVGAYRDDNGKPFVLPSVREAEKRIFEKKLDHEYAPIAGAPGFSKEAAKLVFGEDSPALKDSRVASVQAISGTGALRVGFEFARRFMGEIPIYLPNPSWGNHKNIIKDSRLQLKEYRYWDAKTRGLDFAGLTADLKAAPKGSFITLHACAHNPTGVDPSLAQWKELSALCKDQGHFVFFDSAYQGFASGDPARDAAPIRQFIADGHNVVVAQSFAKNMGLYGGRVGAFHVVCADAAEQDRVMSQLKILIRPMYSNPPIHGARIVEMVLSDPALRKAWDQDVKLMADRIISMRHALKGGLKKAGSKLNWDHITNQIGMFCFTGLSGDQVKTMINTHHVYMTADGRISVAGLTSKNVDYVAGALHEVTK
eukprot:TRINITY_DN15808_c0_g1_i1.p1 TRINITY_DN15808_c0_g1~~TRINITY_DN15808_c0_g1_i1.p1  ORF type:complete len:420 (-),score=94.45 TRINITY_DN15808_c0_g1_i1:29-1288(-)